MDIHNNTGKYEHYSETLPIAEDLSNNTEICSFCGIVHKEEQFDTCPKCANKQYLRRNPLGKDNYEDYETMPNSKYVWFCSKCGYYEDK